MFVNPLFTGVQELPLLEDINTPPPFVPANSTPFALRRAKERTLVLVSPEFTGVQELPLFDEL